jgi:hypothetical protein
MNARSVLSSGILFFVIHLVLVVPAVASAIIIDGVNDFDAADSYATTTVGTTAFLTADADNLYLGYDGPDINSSSPNNWMVAYVGAGGVGTTTGFLFNTQQASLPFSATHLIRWRTDGVQDILVYDGAGWAASAISFSLVQAGSFVELAVDVADLGSPSEVDVVAFELLDLSPGFTFAGLPGSAFTDGYNPTIVDFLTVPVPEPSTALLLAFGLVALGGRRRRRLG